MKRKKAAKKTGEESNGFSWKEIVTGIGIGVTLGVTVGELSSLSKTDSEQRPAEVVSINGSVKRVIDGDTFVLNSGETIRLIGVDTPETKKPGTPVQCYGPEASEFTARLLPVGSGVKLTSDKQEKDRYGRKLSYVYTEKGLFVNAELIRLGFGKPLFIKPNYEKKNEFVELAETAKQSHLGLWGVC